MSGEPRVTQGPVAEQLEREFPGLRCPSAVVPAPAPGSDPGVVERLVRLADRFNGRRAVELRREPIPAAYRVFFHHIGLDPDVHHTPVEQAALTRLVEGGYGSQGRLHDALRLALLETGVALLAFDEQLLSGPPGLRLSRAAEQVGTGDRAPVLPPGRLVLADRERALTELFGEPLHALPTRSSERLRLVGVQPPGVPDIHVAEAFWICAEALD